MSPEARQRKQKKKKERRESGETTYVNNNFQPKVITPITRTQDHVFDAWEAGQHLLLHGTAGTGKSFISLYLAYQAYMNHEIDKIYIIRSAVPTRDMGFMPGSMAEKAEVYEAPYKAIFTEIFGRGDAYEILKHKNIVEFVTTSYVRGITLDRCVAFTDEIANLSLHELDSVITRAGKNCRLIFSGDVTQSDFTKEFERTGLGKFMEIIKEMDQFSLIQFTVSDVVRSELVKDYIIAKERLNITT